MSDVLFRFVALSFAHLSRAARHSSMPRTADRPRDFGGAPRRTPTQVPNSCALPASRNPAPARRENLADDHGEEPAGTVLLAVKQFQKPSLFVFDWLICWGFARLKSIFAKLFHGKLLQNGCAKMPITVMAVRRPDSNATSDNKASPQGEDEI